MRWGDFSVASTSFVSLVCVAAMGASSCKNGGAPPASAPGACGAALNTSPTGAAWVAPADVAQSVAASFSVTLDPANAALASQWLQPHPEALTITGGGSGLTLVGGAKTFAQSAGRIEIELYVVNTSATGVAAATATIGDVTGNSTFYDLTASPLAASSTPGAMTLGGVAPEGTSTSLRFGFDADGSNSPITFSITLAGTATRRTSTSSSPISASADGREIWAIQRDANVVSVLDTATDTRLAQIPVAGAPSSVALTPDGAFALVTCATCNQLEVIDRRTSSRPIVQIFGETEGIGRDPQAVVVTPDGTRAFVSSYVGDSVTAFTRVAGGFKVSATIPVGRRPVGMSVTPDGHTLLVSHFLPRNTLPDNEGWLTIVDADALSQVGETVLRDDEDLTEAQCIAQIQGFDQDPVQQLSFEAVPTQLAGAFLDPGGATAWVPGLRVAPFPILEGDLTGTGFDFVVKGANSPSAVWPLDARNPRATRTNALPSLGDITDRAEGFLACGDWAEEVEATTAFPLSGQTNQEENSGSVLPSGATPISESGVSRFVAFTRGGRRALVLSYNADEIMVVDAATHHPTSQSYFMLTGSNPIGMAVTPDGTKGYVAYEDSLFASVLDLSAYADPTTLPPTWVPYRFDYSNGAGQGGGIVTFGAVVRDTTNVPSALPLHETKQIPLVDKDPMDPVLRRGKVLFTSSNPIKYPTLSGTREASCSSCHPNGGNDGSIWGTMEGERRTLALWGGTSGRGWLHASATHADAAVFATVIVKERLGGTGLSAADVTALSSYVAFGIPEMQRPVVDAQLVATGEAIFAANCTGCHAGAKHTSGAPDPSSPYGGGLASGPNLLNVDSATEWAGAILGAPYAALFAPTPKTILTTLRGDRALGTTDPLTSVMSFEARPDRARGAFKAPALVNEWENVVFFHDGRVDSLNDAVTDMTGRIGLSLSADEANALVEYLKTL